MNANGGHILSPKSRKRSPYLSSNIAGADDEDEFIHQIVHGKLWELQGSQPTPWKIHSVKALIHKFRYQEISLCSYNTRGHKATYSGNKIHSLFENICTNHCLNYFSSSIFPSMEIISLLMMTALFWTIAFQGFASWKRTLHLYKGTSPALSLLHSSDPLHCNSITE